MANRKITQIAVDSDFFKNVFEPSRKNYEKKLKIKISQPKFTKMLMNNGFRFNMPKLDKKIKIVGGKKNKKPFTF
jgi:hypothetical protein